MTTLSGVLLFLAVLLYVKLIFVRAIRFDSRITSTYDFKRKLAAKDAATVKIAHREELLPELRALKTSLEVLLQIAVTLLFVAALGWLNGTIVAIIALLIVNILAKLPFIHSLIHKYTDKYEPYVLKVAEALRPLLKVMSDISSDIPAEYKPTSRDEILHIVETSGHLLTKDEKTLITHALHFKDVTVGKIMTPRSVVKSIEKKEVLGPLTLTDLHNTGHSRFPVTDGDLDHVVGILYAHDFMNTKRQGKVTAEKVMEAKVFYVHEGQSLEKALAAFLRTRHHLFIVVNEFEETTGVITIEDVIEKLIGRKIVDEFDQYEDLRAVARLVAAERRKSNTSERI